MQDNKWKKIQEFVIKNCKIVFPAVLLIVAAFTVMTALGARNEMIQESLEPEATEEPFMEEPVATIAPEENHLMENNNAALHSVIATYYNAMATGDAEAMVSICNEYSENEILRLREKAKYLDYYPVLEVYTKQGYEKGSVVAYIYYKIVFVNHTEEVPGFQALYVRTDENGKMFVDTGELSEEVNDYITLISTQDDVVELNNRVNVEYNEVVSAHPELLSYIQELSTQVNTAVGTALAKENITQQEETTTPSEEPTETEQPMEQEPEPEPEPQPPVEVILYGVATTTVNVRSSDSEKADKLGKLNNGTRVRVFENGVNGWSKISFNNKEGYVKTEYLRLEEPLADVPVIGTVTATTNINVRASASEKAERLGVLSGGESLELIEEENGWCKVKYNGQIGFVKSDYVNKS